MIPIASCLGDIHLSPHIWTRFPHIVGDAALGFHAFVAEAIALKAPIVIAGDLFDVAKPPPEVIAMCRSGFDACAEAGIPVHVIQGNHDKQTTPWVKAIHEHPQYVGDGKPFRLGAYTAIASDYRLMDDIHQFLDAIQPGHDILFLHQAVRQALAIDGAWNCDLEWVPRSVKLTVLGDIHKPLDMVYHGDRRAHYTGAAHARDISQIDPKSFLVINSDLSIRRAPLPSRAIRKFLVVNDTHVAELETWLGSAVVASHSGFVLPPFAWVVYAPELAPKIRDIQSRFGHSGRAILFCDPAPSAEAVIEIATEPETADTPDLASALARYVDKAADPLLFNFLSEVLQSKNTLDVVVSYREKVLNNG